MNEVENVTLSEIICDTGSENRQIFLQTKRQNDGDEGFDLLVLDGSCAWEGQISEEALDRNCEALKMDFNTYVKETAAALTKSSVSDVSFECVFKPLGASSGRLTWKKVPAQSIKFNLGSVDLKKVTNTRETLTSVLSQCISSTHALQTQIVSLQSLNERLTHERQNALKRLDKCVTAKDELEKDLYSKFVAVLNSKKEKILELEANQMPQEVEGAINFLYIVPQTKDLCAVYDNDTDEEASPPPRKKPAGKTTRNLQLESSLNLGDDDEDEAQQTPVPRRSVFDSSS
ncbi:DNA repair protein XRCC4-like [Elysia marginata]|uniref:DNA repair protein XRCC4-like n=1 Tax=Elysia marginata TaxID=1093978 RepID=A0AAV4HYT4_9GAST|nr:DNA repair protein XRCC4-like [Elysia marginata]